ncbi:MAG TPA: YaaR family protein, partial [bacterium]|nr:YaaR family protein [bacterium]
MKVTRSENKSGPSAKLPKKTKGKEEPGLFSRLLGLSGISAVDEIKESEFQEINKLSDIISIENREELERLITEIDKAGSEFSKKQVYATLIKYKTLIQQFMGIIVKCSYEVQQRIGKKSLFEDKIYSVVHKIDESLEELSEAVLNKQIDNIRLLNKLDEIRGLLI